ncbi:hypothetical protein GCM10010269_69770 [Streptomyces humidus]|uniref:Uncharacterized protein n=1 Tax=Streptomyces humidus TaxID=52259 RepID=A0A918G7A1_9ACTN|nr:hypothetical protein GCM10010269_69770 [Streptomyces humidus]
MAAAARLRGPSADGVSRQAGADGHGCPADDVFPAHPDAAGSRAEKEALSEIVLDAHTEATQPG